MNHYGKTAIIKLMDSSRLCASQNSQRFRFRKRKFRPRADTFGKNQIGMRIDDAYLPLPCAAPTPRDGLTNAMPASVFLLIAKSSLQ